MLRIYYHRDFDGMAAAAILADALEACRGESILAWSGVNFDRTLDWDRFALGERFALVDFHFHARAEYWFDHHPTTFLSEADRASYRPSERRRFDPQAQSCPPIILSHAGEHWGFTATPAHLELARWSNVIDAALFRDARQALFGEEPALCINRALTCAPDFDFYDRLVALMRRQTLPEIAEDEHVNACFRRAARNRDHALEAFAARVLDRTETVLLADLRSKKIRRERFAPFFLYPELHYAVTLLPTRAGVHITAASNPWNRPRHKANLGQMLLAYGGGGHEGVGGVNPPDEVQAERWARELFDRLRQVEAEAGA